MRRVVVVFVLWGCAQSPQQRAEEVCATFCDCALGTGVPSAVQECVDQQCLPAIPAVTDACMSCVHQHESVCTTLESSCESLCFGVATPNLPGGTK